MNITTTFQSNSQTTRLLVSTSARYAETGLLPLTVEDITGDIEHIIAKVIWPYIDPTSFALNAEDLRAECRAKLARIISEGHLAKCQTRAKAFAFVKVAFRNHVRSLVEKNAFSMKRTGHKPSRNTNEEFARKPRHVPLDDPEMEFQLGKDDVSVRQREFLEELYNQLSPSEIAMLYNLTCIDLRASNSDYADDVTKGRSRSLIPGASRKAKANLLKKCRQILARCG
jgi:hypothetical protein